MKKIGIILIIMLVIVFLSTRTGKIEKKSLSGVSKEQAVLEKNKDKYNKHIRFYNRILNIDKGLLYYFEDAGMDKKFKNIQNEEITADIAIDKNFIDYRNIINDISDTTVILNRDALVRALDRAQVLSDPGRANLIKIEISENHMIIKSNSEVGDVKEVVETEQEGEDLDIAFNARYMQEGVRAFDSEKIKLSFKSSLNPCLIYPVDNKYEDEDFTYLVLPVRLAN